MCTSSVYMHLQSDFTDFTRHPVCWKFRLYADECLPGDGVWHHQTEYTPSAQNLKISSSKTHPWIPSIFNKFLHLQKKNITNSTTADSDMPVLILMNINVSMLDLDKNEWKFYKYVEHIWCDYWIFPASVSTATDHNPTQRSP